MSQNSLTDWYFDLASGRRKGLTAAMWRAALAMASVPYGLAVSGRNRLWDAGWKAAQRASVPVVSIGNLTLGGTGKTPAVEWVARFYRSLDFRVAVLSRGYGSTGGANDEALLLEENLPDVPHLQGTDRAALARIAVEELESELLILDDGFQHRRLERDLDVVLIDSTNPWGYGWLFPRGLLREPLCALKRADLVVLTRCDLISANRLAQLRKEVEKLAPGKPLVESLHAAQQLVRCVHGKEAEGHGEGMTQAPLGLLQGRPVAGFCGIGNPDAFRETLERLQGKLVSWRTYPDHHPYSRQDVEELREWAAQLPADAIVVTTQKDLVKLRLAELKGRPLWALRIALQITAGQDVLDRLLKGVLQ